MLSRDSVSAYVRSSGFLIAENVVPHHYTEPSVRNVLEWRGLSIQGIQGAIHALETVLRNPAQGRRKLPDRRRRAKLVWADPDSARQNSGKRKEMTWLDFEVRVSRGWDTPLF
jgi:hypothetical protein